MNFFNRQATKKSPTPTPTTEILPLEHKEPVGHMHGNFRHWIWLKPSNQRAQ